MFKTSKIFFCLLLLFMMVWQLPACYNFFVAKSVDTPFTLYSGIAGEFAISDTPLHYPWTFLYLYEGQVCKTQNCEVANLLSHHILYVVKPHLKKNYGSDALVYGSLETVFIKLNTCV